MKEEDTVLTWNTTTLYPAATAPELEADFATGAASARSFREKFAGKVATLDARQLLEALAEFEKVQETIVKPQLYAYLLFAADSENDLHKTLSQRASEFGNLMSRELLFLELEIMEIPDDRFRALTEDIALDGYRYFLESVRRFRPHTLSEREEQLLKIKNMTGTEAFTRLFDELSASFRYQMELDGEEKEFTGEELLGLLHHRDATVRERAFSLFLQRHEENSILFSTVLNTIALDHSQEVELRQYRHPMEPTNIGNNLPEEVINRLMDVSEKNYPLAQRFFRLKARMLGMPKLKNTDIYAPAGETTRQYTFAESRDLVLQAYEQLTPEFRSMAERFFTEGRIDAMPRPGKSGGAFCMGMTPSLPPYVLLNFTGNLRDVATMAHELGHGVHFVLSQKQTLLNYHAPLPLAETASVFGEMLLTRYLLEREDDRQVKISLLSAKIEDIIATTFRQNVLTRFEERVHLERKEGLLTSGRICDLWWEENGKLYGDTVDMIEPYRWGWTYISHFIHTRFYCYSYTFAELLVLSLYQKYLDEGRSFIPTYESILRSGNSRSPIDTVSPAGINLEDPDFWQKGYDFLEKLISQLEELL